MSIKYAEITIIFDTENEGLFSNLSRNWLGRETFCDETTDIIISFDDKNIYVKDELKDCQFKFFESVTSILPLHFEVKEKKDKYRYIYFMKQPIKQDDGNLHLDFKTIFSTEIRNKYKLVPSCFNCIYYCIKNNNQDVFSILKIYSNEDKPRFLLAYDSDEFNKDEITYLVNCIFKNKYNNTL